MDDEFPARCILDEDVKKKQYKVEWEGTNPETGRNWTPTWEPYEYVSEVLANEWARKKRKRSDAGVQKASRAALRNYDLKRSRTETTSDEESTETKSDEEYVSPADTWTSSYSDEEEPRAKQKQKAKSKPKRKSVASGSGASHKVSAQSREPTELSSELSGTTAPRSLIAPRSKNGRPRRSAELYANTISHGKRQRQDTSGSSAPRSTRSPKKLRTQLQNLDVLTESSERTSESDEDIPLVARRTRLSSGSGQIDQHSDDESVEPASRLIAIPEALRLRTATTSVSKVTGGSTVTLSENISRSDSSRFELALLLPSARQSHVSEEDSGRSGSSNTARRAQKPLRGKPRRVAQPLFRSESDDERPRMAVSYLPSFKKGNKQVASTSEDPLRSHQRRASAALREEREDWALLDNAGKDFLRDMNGMEVIQSAVQHPAEHTENPTSPLLPRQPDGIISHANDSHIVVSGRHVRSPGPRISHANIEKPRMPVKVPEPSVFRPALASTQMTEDIHQFSSQASPPEGSSSEEIFRNLTIPSPFVINEAELPRDLPSEQETNVYAEYETAPEPSHDVVMVLEPSPTATSVNKPQETEAEPIAATPQEAPAGNADESIVGSAAPALDAKPVLRADSQHPLRSNGPEAIVSTPPEPQRKRVLGPSETVETVEKERVAINMIRGSTLLASEDTRQDLIVFIESPGFYCAQSRPLTTQPSWEFELERSTDEQGQISWHLLVDTGEPGWKLEKRVRAYKTLSENEGNDQILALYNDLLIAHTALKSENDAASLRMGQLEKDLAFMREQDRSKGEKMEGLAADKHKLEAELQVMRQQVNFGVKQIELIWSAREAKLRQELDVAQKQLSLAHALIKASDVEALRQKAARTDELEAREARRIIALRAPVTSQDSTSSKHYSEFLASLRDLGRNGNQAPSPVIDVQAEVESEDGSFVGGSDDSNSMSSDTGDEDSDEFQPADVPIPAILPDFSGVQFPPFPAAQLMNTALASAEGILPGGLASISPAPATLATSTPATHQADASGDTTEFTSVSGGAPPMDMYKKNESQQSTSSGAQLVESEDILELDSGILESQLAYACRWGQAAGQECRKLFASQKELYDHVVDEHATSDT